MEHDGGGSGIERPEVSDHAGRLPALEFDVAVGGPHSKDGRRDEDLSGERGGTEPVGFVDLRKVRAGLKQPSKREAAFLYLTKSNLRFEKKRVTQLAAERGLNLASAGRTLLQGLKSAAISAVVAARPQSCPDKKQALCTTRDRSPSGFY